MPAASTFIPVLKYGFLTLVVSCAGYLIANVTVFKHIHGENINDLLVRYQISMQEEGVEGVLYKGFERCLTHPSKVFCLMTAQKHFGQNHSEETTTPDPDHSLTRRVSPKFQKQIHPVFLALSSFAKLSRRFAIQPILMDPSILFCMLNPISTTLLLKNGFNPARFQAPMNSVFMGIDEDAAQILGANMNQNWGFNEYTKITSWKGLPVQFTLQRASATIYVAVLYRRNSYLWRSALVDVKHEHLIKDDTVFENFTAVRVSESLDLELYIPSDPVHFLYQMNSFSFFPCHFNASTVVQPHPTLTREQLENRAVVALQALKAAFHPYFVRFWLWKESSSGMLYRCSIFEKVTDLNLAAMNSDIEKMNLTEIFSDNEFLTLNSEFLVVENKLSKISLDCHGFRINLFIAHEDGENIGFYEDNNGSTEWVTYSKPRLVSTDVYGQIVYIPGEYVLKERDTSR